MQIETPLVRSTIGGQILDGLITAEIETVGFNAAGQFRLVFAMDLSSGYGLAYFSSLGLQNVTIEFSRFAEGFVVLLSGKIDNMLIFTEN